MTTIIYKLAELDNLILDAYKPDNALEVSVDNLNGNTDQLLEKNIVRRISGIRQLPQNDKAHLFALMDAFLSDHKAK